MNPLEQWLQENKMNPAFQAGELCRIFGLTMVSANGIISFTGGDDSIVARHVQGKAYNHLLEEIAKEDVTPKFVAPNGTQFRDNEVKKELGGAGPMVKVTVTPVVTNTVDTTEVEKVESKSKE